MSAGVLSYRERVIHGHIFLQGVQVRALVDHDRREIQISDRVPKEKRAALLRMARGVAECDGDRRGPFVRLDFRDRGLCVSRRVPIRRR
jgi:hypothetical protein